MRHLLLIAICFYSCKENYEKPLLNKQMVKINGIEFVEIFDPSFKIDSSYINIPNACYYTSYDSCRYLLINGTWRIKDTDSLYFSSIDITSKSVLEITQQAVGIQTTLNQLKDIVQKYKYDVVDWKSKNGKILILETTDHCHLHFRFQNERLKQVAYGTYAYY